MAPGSEAGESGSGSAAAAARPTHTPAPVRSDVAPVMAGEGVGRREERTRAGKIHNLTEVNY
jgi:hypothetical protein